MPAAVALAAVSEYSETGDTVSAAEGSILTSRALLRALRRLLPRWLGGGEDSAVGAAFVLDLTDRQAAQAIFEEGSGSLLTDGSRSCMETSHLEYNETLHGLPGGQRGLLLRMDDEGIECGNGAAVATGHLSSWDKYSYGDFTWVARVAHAPGGGSPAPNAFACLAVFVHGALPHNEIAWRAHGRTATPSLCDVASPSPTLTCASLPSLQPLQPLQPLPSPPPRLPARTLRRPRQVLSVRERRGGGALFCWLIFAPCHSSSSTTRSWSQPAAVISAV